MQNMSVHYKSNDWFLYETQSLYMKLNKTHPWAEITLTQPVIISSQTVLCIISLSTLYSFYNSIL